MSVHVGCLKKINHKSNEKSPTTFTGSFLFYEVAVKSTLYPTESGENRTRTQAAIDQVCSLPVDANGFRGAVLLKKGRYRLNDGTIPNLSDGYGSALRIWASGVMILNASVN